MHDRMQYDPINLNHIAVNALFLGCLYTTFVRSSHEGLEKSR